MKEVIYIVLLLIGVALTTGGVLVSVRQKQRTGEQYFIFYLLVLVFLSVFGFYNLWGTGFISYILAPFEENDLLTAMLRFLHYLSLPFIMAAWLMLIRFENAISRKKSPLWIIIAIQAAILALLILAGFFPVDLSFSGIRMDSQKLVITVIHLACFFYSGISLLFLRQEKSEWAESRPVFWLGFAFLAQGSLQVPGLALMGSDFWPDSIFMFLFFISLIIPMVLLYRSPLIRKKKEVIHDDIKGFKAFCREYDISPREAEIILEICKGKSNKEISETLFISLQTVKDHAHRIFYKTDVKSRVQLTNLVRERN